MSQGPHAKDQWKFTFIDLFCGIGGFRIAFEKAGGSCIFSSEWDRQCRKTHEANFKDIPVGDITQVKPSDIPSHDILVAGFPCQPFSLAGVVKKKSLNKPVGFEDLTQGTLFFDIARIIKDRKPKAFLLENVKNLKTHDKGKTFRIIMETLANDLGYTVYYKIIDAKAVVPQHRERIYIVGFRAPSFFRFPTFQDRKPFLFKSYTGIFVEQFDDLNNLFIDKIFKLNNLLSDNRILFKIPI